MSRAVLLAFVVLGVVGCVLLLVRDVEEDGIGAELGERTSEETAATALVPTLGGSGEQPGASRPRQLLVTVVEGDARTPVSEAAVTVTVLDETRADRRLVRSGSTDAAGRIQLDLSETGMAGDGLRVHVDSASNPPQVQTFPVVRNGEEPRLFEATATMRVGVVTRAYVVPPPGVPLSAVRLWQTGPTASPIELDERGAFSFDRLAQGAEIPVQAAALHEGVRYAARARFVAGRDDFALPWTGVREGDRTLLRVRFRDHEGSPVDAVLLWGVHGPDGWSWAPDREGWSEVLLDFVYGPDVRLHLVATPQKALRLGPAFRAEVPASETSVGLVFPPERVLSGRLEWEGEGLPTQFRVSLGLRLGHEGDAARTVLPTLVAPDEAGAFRFEGLGPYPYDLVVLDGASRPVARRAIGRTEGEVMVVVPAPGTLRLIVKDERGKPVPGAAATASLPPDGIAIGYRDLPLDPAVFPFRSVASAVADDSGRLVLEGLDRERGYRIILEGPREGEPYVPREFQGWRAWRSEVEVRLYCAHAISGRVLDVSGNPVASRSVTAAGIGLYRRGARVYRRTLDGRATTTIYPHARTNADGAFRIHPLRKSRWKLYVDGADMPGVEVRSGDRDVVLTIPDEDARPRIQLRLHVLGLLPEDRGVVAWYGRRSARLDDLGEAVIDQVKEGAEEDVWIAGLSEGRYVWERKIRAGTEPVVLRPSRGGTARGRVRLPSGVVLTELRVSPQGPDPRLVLGEPLQGAFPCRSDVRAGTFEVVGLPPGRWEIRLRARGDGGRRRGLRWYRGRVLVSPGDEVVVDLP